jgi:Flp pilus assembly protein TadD
VPATATSLNALGNALAACENQIEAVAAFEQALFLEPDDVHLLCNAAMAAARAGDRPTARRHLDRARATDPQNPAVIAAADVLEQTP